MHRRTLRSHREHPKFGPLDYPPTTSSLSDDRAGLAPRHRLPADLDGATWRWADRPVPMPYAIKPWATDQGPRDISQASRQRLRQFSSPDVLCLSDAEWHAALIFHMMSVVIDFRDQPILDPHSGNAPGGNSPPAKRPRNEGC